MLLHRDNEEHCRQKTHKVRSRNKMSPTKERGKKESVKNTEEKKAFTTFYCRRKLYIVFIIDGVKLMGSVMLAHTRFICCSVLGVEGVLSCRFGNFPWNANDGGDIF